MTSADEQLAECIKTRTSFLLDAGAGAGKTYSLVKVLQLILRQHSAELRAKGQKVACITFTNVAKNEIASRVNLDPLISVTTIHDFLWSLIASHQKELRAAVLVFNDGLKPESSRKVEAAELAAALIGKRIVYADLGTNLRKGRLFHDDLLDVARIMFKEHPRLAQIAVAKYPFIFIDEYQDTSRPVIDIVLDTILPTAKDKVIVGLFGDKMQNIFSGSSHPGIGEIPAELRARLHPVVKPDNRRCPIAVINLLNHVRDDIKQVPAADNAQGEAIYIGAPPEGGLDAAEALLKERGWTLNAEETKQLLLTHKLIARKGGYFELVSIYGDRGGFFREDLLGGEDKTIAFFIDKVESLVAAWEAGRHGQAISILKLSNFRLGSIADKARVRKLLEGLVQIRRTGTVRDVLLFLREAQLFDLLEDLATRLDGPLPVPDQDAVDAKYRAADEKFYAALLELPYTQVIGFVDFFLDHTPFATKHGVKGAEFPDVIVVLDDAGSNWTQYSFDKYLTDFDLEKNPRRWAKTRNLFYVSCSRPKRRLAVIDLNPPSDAKTEKMKTWFGPDNVIMVRSAN
ncbi:DNA helicase-2/ATP-dependent DNA helicase PcrA [Phyllobacterium trifolii]|uniref:DNA helicase-2/ATP-dependent DNA helicase PcrA n=1 Tax=Phyllobacterium trifolii TaxID=300193 RepID=A0A839UF88_9HYPH|nr:UvrD-helicase domain-containing protein [Phyllobacterium trifolii]MBB3147510.1 DNA helicase-2/ATP-dependent DNA helicase PcrA [Phyllobacterium trifolii]